MSNLDPADVWSRLGLPAETMAWLRCIEPPATTRGPVLPDDAEAGRLLEQLGVEPIDRAETLASRPNPEAHPAPWWVLDRAYHDLLSNMGRGQPVEGFGGWPGMPEGTGAVGRRLYAWVFLAALPEVRRYHADRGVPDDISWDSLVASSRLPRESHPTATIPEEEVQA